MDTTDSLCALITGTVLPGMDHGFQAGMEYPQDSRIAFLCNLMDPILEFDRLVQPSQCCLQLLGSSWKKLFCCTSTAQTRATQPQKKEWIQE